MGVAGAALIVLPLIISGYLFNLIFYPLRYFSYRAEGQKLFFMAAGSGLFLGLFVALAIEGIKSTESYARSLWPILSEIVHAAVPMPFSGKVIAALIVAVGLAYFFNFSLWIIYGRGHPSTKRIIYNKLISHLGDSLSQLLRKAADDQKLVLLTLKSRKIYCGRVFEVPVDIESERACIELLPSFSGYRDKQTLRFGREKTEYPVIELWVAKQYVYSLRGELEILEKEVMASEVDPDVLPEVELAKAELLQEIEHAESVVRSVGDPDGFDLNDWIKVIPISEIESGSFYDLNAYDLWFKGISSESDAEAPGTEVLSERNP